MNFRIAVISAFLWAAATRGAAEQQPLWKPREVQGQRKEVGRDQKGENCFGGRVTRNMTPSLQNQVKNAAKFLDELRKLFGMMAMSSYGENFRSSDWPRGTSSVLHFLEK